MKAIEIIVFILWGMFAVYEANSIRSKDEELADARMSMEKEEKNRKKAYWEKFTTKGTNTND